MLQKKKENVSSKVIAAGIAGAALGAVGVLMSDKKNRKEVGKKLDTVKKWGDTTVDDLKKKVDGLDLPQKTEKLKEDVEKMHKSGDLTEKESSNIGE